MRIKIKKLKQQRDENNMENQNKVNNSNGMKTEQTIKEIEKVKREEIHAPLIGLEKWRISHKLTSPDMEAYVEAVQNQKLVLVCAILILTIVVHYLRYGVP
jgi:hypothetical protein